MHRKIIFATEPEVPSFGNNGSMRTVGCFLGGYGGQNQRGRVTLVPPDEVNLVAIKPINSRGNISYTSISIDPDATGELAVFLAEVFIQGASQEAKDNLMNRIRLICEGQADGARLEDEIRPLNDEEKKG
jgi:hypothetical protein